VTVTKLSLHSASAFRLAGLRFGLLLAASLAVVGAIPAAAGQSGTAAGRSPEESSAESPQSGGDPAAADYNGLDYTRPQQYASVRLRFQTASSPTTQTDQERIYLQLGTKIDIPVGWTLGIQGQAPFTNKDVTTFATADTTRNDGLGDSFVQAALSHPIDSHWAYGFGARLVAPTGGDALGTGKWQIMPGLGVRYSFLETGPDTYFAPVLRWALSFSGNPAKPTINQPQIAPTLNIGLPQRWFVTLYPSNDIRINTGTAVAGQTGQLFLPFDAAVGRDFTDRVSAYLEVSVPIIKDYPVYNFKTELRVSVRF
jgi:hypothetical protein